MRLPRRLRLGRNDGIAGTLIILSLRGSSALPKQSAWAQGTPKAVRLPRRLWLARNDRSLAPHLDLLSKGEAHFRRTYL